MLHDSARLETASRIENQLLALGMLSVSSRLAMGHPLRMFEPDAVYEVTTRTIQARFLLRPSKEFNEAVIGVIGWGQELCPNIRLYAVDVQSNHMTWLLSAQKPDEISRFLGLVHGRISQEVGWRHDWTGKTWGRRYRAIRVVDNEALKARLVYLLSQGTKDGLVASPYDLPGVNSVRALAEGVPLEGLWFERDQMRRTRSHSKHECARKVTVRFSKLPCWAHLDDSAYQARIQKIIGRCEQDAREQQTRSRRRPLGAKAMRRIHPHHRPTHFAKSPAPICHASRHSRREAYRKRYRAFCDAFRNAAELLKLGIRDALFPLYAFPPRLPVVT